VVGYCILERYESYNKKFYASQFYADGDSVLGNSQKADRISKAAEEKKENKRKGHYIMVLFYDLSTSLELERNRRE